MFTVTYGLTETHITHLNARTLPLQITTPTSRINAGTFDITPNASPRVSPMDAVLTTPVLVELFASGFDIPYGNEYILRFPRISKLHSDRPWEGGVSCVELQNLG